MEFTRLNWVISLYVKIQEVKKPRVQPKMEFRAYGMGFGNSRCLVSLPTKVNLMKLKILADPLCHLCGRIPKDNKHALWDCEAVKSVWCKDFSWVNQFEAIHVTFLIKENF